VEVDGHQYPDESAFDFGFESAALKGLRAGGVGYTSSLDSHVAHGGTQSLQLRYDAAPQAGVSAWPQILSRLEAARDEYRGKGVPDWDIEWAMQNARVVVQNMELPSAPGVARDRSMAANVKWIADQNPRAKIVLWAHNGHVATGGGLGEQTMGSHLRGLFGEDMVVIGTAFNQGAFQAQPFPGEPGGPRSVTVPSAPADSLDATFAATNFPIFAIDLRHAPTWFRDPHRSREIGCCYPQKDPPDALLGPIRAADAFDAMIFIETVHAARPNLRR